MTRAPDLPQTVGEASAFGWRWLTVECRRCRHRADLTLAELAPALPLAAVGRRLACRQCDGRKVYVSLGANLGGGRGRMLATWKRIAFNGEHVIRPVRD